MHRVPLIGTAKRTGSGRTVDSSRSGVRRSKSPIAAGVPSEAVSPTWAQGGETLTTATGVPVDDTDNSLRVGERGPTLLDDFHLREKIMHFDHERIPERVVHARGAGAHGVFRLTTSIEDLTCAQVLCDTTSVTQMFVRFVPPLQDHRRLGGRATSPRCRRYNGCQRRSSHVQHPGTGVHDGLGRRRQLAPALGPGSYRPIVVAPSRASGCDVRTRRR
jgi:Catalase